jgi:hypothetical protein
MLLRWFHNLYDLEVIEEEAFMKWKEDISDDYPGKGNALFQVIVIALKNYGRCIWSSFIKHILKIRLKIDLL